MTTNTTALNVNVLSGILLAVSLPMINPASIMNRFGNDVSICTLVLVNAKFLAIAAYDGVMAKAAIPIELTAKTPMRVLETYD